MIRTVLLRGAWLMLGAAISVAAAILGSVAATGGAEFGGSLPWSLLAVLLVAIGVGLLPGVHEIEVTAARTLLGVAAPLSADAPPGRHRWRTAIWTTFHATAGLLTGFGLFGLLPGGVVTLWLAAQGRLDLLDGLYRDWPSWLVLAAGVGMLVAAVAAPVVAGTAAARLAPVALGPSAADRLALAERRLAAERRHTALARELHDGIGHALSIISIQAAAARRVADTRPDRTTAALTVIEQTSRGAQAELDHLLGLLRDPAAATTRAVRDDLPAVLARHRAAGMTIELTDQHGSVPPLVWHAALDILAEALANAHRHGAGGAVTVAFTRAGGDLRLRVTNAVAGRGPAGRPPTGGRGIVGMQERAALLGGTLRAGRSAARWQVDVVLPVPDRATATPAAIEEETRP